MKSNNMYKSMLFVVLLSVALKGIGFINRMVIAYFYGTTSGIDIYYICSGFVGGVATIVLSGLSVGVINIYIRDRASKQSESFVSNVLMATVAVMLAFALIQIIGADVIAKLIAQNTDAEYQQKIVLYLRLLAITYPFQALVIVPAAVLQAEQHYAKIKVVNCFSSIISIVCILLFAHKLDEDALLISFIIMYLFNTLFMLTSLRKYWKPTFGNCFKDPRVRTIMLQAIPLMIGVAAHEVNLMVDKALASSYVEGAVSALSYCSVIYVSIEGILISSVITVIFPNISECVAKDAHRALSDKVRETVALLEALLIPVVMYCVFNSSKIIEVLFMRGSFDLHSLDLTHRALIGYVLGLPFLALKDVLTQVHYAYFDTKTPGILTVISVAVNIVLSITLLPRIGIIGITLATSIANLLMALIMLATVRKYNAHLAQGGLIIELLIVVLCAAVQAGIWLLLKQHALFSSFLGSLLGFGVAFVVQIALLAITKSPAIRLAKQILWKKNDA